MPTIEGLEDRIKTLEREVALSRDIRDIERLQRCYGYYLEHGMNNEVKDLFANNNDIATYWLGKGEYHGQEGVKGLWDRNFPAEMRKSEEFLHLIMQLSPIIDVDENGNTAHGRWYASAAVSIPIREKLMHEFAVCCYENDYIKEGGKWKIQTLRARMVYIIRNPKEGFVNPERYVDINDDPRIYMPDEPKFDNPEAYDKWQYPSGYILPFHFKHPVTDKETSDKARNAALDKSNTGERQGNKP
jgi:hypothetical protein